MLIRRGISEKFKLLNFDFKAALILKKLTSRRQNYTRKMTIREMIELNFRNHSDYKNNVKRILETIQVQQNFRSNLLPLNDLLNYFKY